VTDQERDEVRREALLEVRNAECFCCASQCPREAEVKQR
jgi:hypothetical protein